MAQTFLQSARRAQLVDAAIHALADLGAEQASLVRIAERAGVSRGVVNYHFPGGRRELFEAAVDSIYDLGRQEVHPDTLSAQSPRDSVASFVRGSIMFYARCPRHLRALTALYTSRTEDSLRRDEREEHAAEMMTTAGLLRDGQVAGQMREFDVTLMALTIRAVLDTAVGLTAAGAEPEALADELVRTIDAATRVIP
ncbi:TetR family transcriptional regulator [Rhodococcoides trifolii]|uniref:TetR family transcriptional regulator n=1 Tax=Rhodococcoides trifolii TaxID=908250 RepID=A0A917LDJ6_9NOCA|nr:TetR/AcrR family transcriptional regulator [Rhodococcus trifolii]GGG14957.1 TetR family transcriptional regulator [Rhodococcus trifolii]